MRARLPNDLLNFLAAGSPPIAFSPGSANNEAHQFFAAAVDACATRPARNSPYAVRSSIAGDAARFSSSLRFRAAEQTVTTHGSTSSSRRDRQLRKAWRPACPRSCGQCPTISSTIRGGSCSSVWPRKSPCEISQARKLQILSPPCWIQHPCRHAAANLRPGATDRPPSPPPALPSKHWPNRTPRVKSYN